MPRSTNYQGKIKTYSLQLDPCERRIRSEWKDHTVFILGLLLCNVSGHHMQRVFLTWVIFYFIF